MKLVRINKPMLAIGLGSLLVGSMSNDKFETICNTTIRGLELGMDKPAEAMIFAGILDYTLGKSKGGLFVMGLGSVLKFGEELYLR